MRTLTIPCALLGLGACAGPTVHWGDPPLVENPDPSGTPELRAYKETYYRSLGESFRGHLTGEELLRRIDGARLLYLGDLHDDLELHDRLLALLDALQARGVRIALGLEAIGSEDEAAVRAYLDRLASMAELRGVLRARWPRSWLDSDEVDATFYRTVLALARQWRAPVFGLEPAPRVELAQRAELMAGSVGEALERYPDRLVVVIVGQAHVSGGGRLLERVDAPSVACCASMSVSLQEQLVSRPPPANARVLVTESGVALWYDRADS